MFIIFFLLSFLSTFYCYILFVGLIDYYMGFEQCFFFRFFFFLPSARVGHTTDMPRTKLSIHYCGHVSSGRRIVTYARLDLGAADPSDSATSLVINEKQLYRNFIQGYHRARTHTKIHTHTHTHTHSCLFTDIIRACTIIYIYIQYELLHPWPSLLPLSRATTPGIHPDNTTPTTTV